MYLFVSNTLTHTRTKRSPAIFHGFVFLRCCQADQMCEVMLSDSLLTLCCPSVSSADTNTSNLFQLRAALLSQTIVTMAARRACRVTSGCVRETDREREKAWAFRLESVNRPLSGPRELSKEKYFNMLALDVSSIRLFLFIDTYIFFFLMHLTECNGPHFLLAGYRIRCEEE